jgi:2-methylisocitrate lyase-like PEP mutase family enzyme
MPASLKQRLARPDVVVAPGAYDAFTARLVEEAGFEAVYLSGAAVSYSQLAQPDVGLVNQTEMAQRVAMLTQAVNIPVIADGDNGHGNALNVMRTVRLFERAGAAAVQFEDQSVPKRCGHLGGTRLIPTEEMVGKLRAARAARSSSEFLIIGRTDARGVLGLDEAIKRGRAYREAGADVLFIEAPRTRAELEAVAAAFVGVPLVANIVEGGKTPPVSAHELQVLGFSLVLFPNTLTRAFARAARSVLGELRRSGTTEHCHADIVSFAELNRIVGIDQVAACESTFVVDPLALSVDAAEEDRP